MIDSLSLIHIFSDRPRNPGFIEKVGIGRPGQGSQNAGDRHGNHQFDQREAGGSGPRAGRRWENYLIWTLMSLVLAAVHVSIPYES